MNNPIKFIDIKGLEPGDLFSNPDAAARNFGLIYNYWSIKNNVELSSFIYSLTDKNGKLYYTYNTPNWGNSSSSTPNTKIPKGAQIYGLIHTHAAYDENTEDAHHGNQFSGKDIDTYRPHEFKGSYVCTPNGTLVKFHKKDDGNYETINFKDSKYKLPSDSSDPTNNGYTTNLIDSEWEQKPWYIFFIQTFNEYLEER